MPRVRKLTMDEVRTLEDRGKSQRQLTLEEYDRFLSEYAEGDYGEAELDENEKRLTVRNRLKAAAERRGLTIDFMRTRGNALRFRIRSTNGTETAGGVAETRAIESVEQPVETPAPRKGRKRKASSTT